MRSSVLDVTHQDFIKTAKAKGLKQGRIIIRHILRNAMLPMVTVAGMQAGALVGGAVVIETVFAWPGLGRLIYRRAVAARLSGVAGRVPGDVGDRDCAQSSHRCDLPGDRSARLRACGIVNGII